MANVLHVKLITSLALIGMAVLSGCSIRGTYSDASGSDTAKLRFVTKAANATLDYFDADTCMGKTTGLLNNLATLDTTRRVGMKIPPRDAAYLELKVAAGRDILLNANSLNTFGVSCALALNFNAQKDAEYEVAMYRRGNWCAVSLARLQERNGLTVRVSELISPLRSFPACAGRSPKFLNPNN